jgi:hypothetical protein
MPLRNGAPFFNMPMPSAPGKLVALYKTALA